MDKKVICIKLNDMKYYEKVFAYLNELCEDYYGDFYIFLIFGNHKMECLPNVIKLSEAAIIILKNKFGEDNVSSCLLNEDKVNSILQSSNQLRSKRYLGDLLYAFKNFEEAFQNTEKMYKKLLKYKDILQECKMVSVLYDRIEEQETEE